MLIVYFPSNFDVDNSVDKLRSYSQVKIEIVDCQVINSLSTRFPHGAVNNSYKLCARMIIEYWNKQVFYKHLF